MTQKLEWKIAAALRHTGHVTVDQAGECAEVVMALMIAAQSEPATRAVPVAMSNEAREDATHELIQAESRLADLQKALDATYPKHAGEKDRWRAAGHFHRINSAILSATFSIQDARALIAAPTPDAERHVANHAGDFSPLTEERKSQIAESVARRYGDACRAAVELAFAAPIASALPAQPVALTVEQREAIEEVICLARDEGFPGTADMLRSILAAPAQPTDKENGK